MDKIKFKKKINFALGGLLQIAAGAAAFAFGAFLLFETAKSGSDFFYYALAFGSPGTAIELLQKAPPEAEAETPPLSTEFESEEEFGAQTSEEASEGAVSEEPEQPGGEDIPESRRGKVTETQYKAKEGRNYVAYGNAIIKNCTKYSSDKIKEMLKTEHSLSLSTDPEAGPQLLIYHTHATEGYEPYDNGCFDTERGWRSTDPNKSMVAVGEALRSVLKEKGVSTVHDSTLHDSPGYNGSYKRSAETVLKRMEENPSLTVFLDIHRDAIEPSSKEIIKPTAVINGKKAAQIMIISGCDDGTMDMPNFWENLRFAAALASKMEEMYPGLCRPILFDYRRYNMNLSPGLLLIEIGASGNTLEEAQYSAELLGNALAALLTE